MISKALVRWIVGLLLALASLFTFLCLTQPGLKFTASIVKKLMPGTLNYQHISGMLIGPINIKGLHYQDQQNDIKIKSLEFNYQPLKLLTGLLSITHLNIRNAYIKIGPGKDQKKTSGFSFPFNIAIKQSTLQNVTIDTGKIYHIQSAYLAGAFTGQKADLQFRTKIRKPYPIKIRLIVHGAPNQYKFTLETWGKHLNAILKGEGNLQQVHFITHEAHILKGSLNADATVHFKQPLSWNVKLYARNLQLNLLNPKWPSPFTVNLTSNGTLVADKPKLFVDANIKAPSISGTIKADNQHGLTAQWDLLISQASKYIPNAKGQLKTIGHLTGTLKHPIITGSLRATRFSYKQIYAENLTASGRIDTSQQTLSNIKMQGKDIAISNIQLATLNVIGKGTFNQHQIQIKLNRAGTQYTLHLQGHYANSLWQGQLQTFQVKGHPWGTWNLAQASTLSISTSEVKFSDLCLIGQARGKLCLRGFWHRTQPWQLQAHGAHIPPAILTSLMHLNLKIQSKIQLQAVLNGQGSQITHGNIALALSPGKIAFAALGRTITRRILSSNLNATISKSGLNARYALRLDSRDSLNANITLPQFNQDHFNLKQKIVGRVNITLNSLKWFTAITPGIELPKGALYANLNVGGVLKEPELSGKANFKRAQIDVPSLGLQFKDTTVAINAHGRTIQFTVSTKSNGGSILVTGKTDFASKEATTLLSINMQNALIYNTNEYKVYATTPMLTANIKGRNLTITGTVNIPKAMISPKRFQNIKTLPESEIEFIGNPPTPFQQAWVIKSHVFVTIGKDVKVDAKGVTGKLTGNLMVTNTKQEQMIATGQIYIAQGKFTAYGTNLTFSKDSRAEYQNSPIGNPNLNITASKEIKVTQNGFAENSNNITVGIHVTGNLKNPKVALFSIPATLSQADILSYLVLGYASVSGKASDVGLILRAVNAFNLTQGKQGQGLVSELQQGLGLSELGIETQSTIDALGQPLGERQTSFVVGKQLSPYLYLRYSLGLNNLPGIESGSMVQLRFSLSRHWMLQTNAGTADQGADIFYMIDK